MRANLHGRVGRRPARGAAALARAAVFAGGKIFGPGKVAAVRNPTPRLVAPILRRPSGGRRKRQIKILFNRNDRHLNTSTVLA